MLIDDIFICVTNDLNVFADDSTLSRIIASPAHRAAAAASLNTDLLALQAWASLWLVKFNDDKTELVTFSRKADVAAFRSGKPVDPSARRRGRPRKLNSRSLESKSELKVTTPTAPLNPHPPLVFCGVTLQEATSFKIVGLTITHNLSWTEHVARTAKNANRAVALLKRSSAVLDGPALATVYKSHVRSRMEYCCPIWMAAGKAALGRLDRVDARARRIIGLKHSLPLPSLSHRRWVAGLCVFHRLLHGYCPEAIADLRPASLLAPPARTSRRTRGASASLQLAHPARAPDYWARSFVPRFTKAFNALPAHMQAEPSPQKFKVLTNSINHSFD